MYRARHTAIMLDDINLGQIGNDNKFNFKNNDDEDREIYDNYHACNYYEMSEFKTNFAYKKNGFSINSHNIRILNVHLDNLLDIFNIAKIFRYSVVRNTECPKNYSIDGYGKFEYITNHKTGPPTQIVVWKWVCLLTQILKTMKFLEDESVFFPHVYESIWVKSKIKDGKDKIIGNVYRPILPLVKV